MIVGVDGGVSRPKLTRENFRKRGGGKRRRTERGFSLSVFEVRENGRRTDDNGEPERRYHLGRAVPILIV